MRNPSTQKERILHLLKSRGNEGVKVYELIAPRPEGLGIAQYNARIKELRQAGFPIINVSPGHFVLRGAEPARSQRKPVRLDPVAHEKWSKMGAFLRGEGPKPDTRLSFETTIQESLL